MPEPKNPIRETDAEAIAIATTLLSDARIGSLSFIDPATGGPSVSRTIIAHYGSGRLVTLISDLSGHSKALTKDTRCALMIGEPGRGDPLAHARMTVLGTAKRLPSAAKQDAEFADFFLKLHPKAKLYFSFGDFAFWQIEPHRVDLNGGFGKAYCLTPDDLKAITA